MERAAYLVVIQLDCKSFSHIPAIKSEILDEGFAENESGAREELRALFCQKSQFQQHKSHCVLNVHEEIPALRTRLQTPERQLLGTSFAKKGLVRMVEFATHLPNYCICGSVELCKSFLASSLALWTMDASVAVCTVYLHCTMR